jgi:Arc/MetJ family transcription regulator
MDRAGTGLTARRGEGPTVRTNIEIDDELLKEAMVATGQSTKWATVEAALRRVVKLYRQKRAGEDLAGIGWEGDLAAMPSDRSR